MGIISDAIDALEDWCKDLFKDGITSQFDGISDLLSDTFLQTTGTGGSGGLVNDFVTQHPSQSVSYTHLLALSGRSGRLCRSR